MTKSFPIFLLLTVFLVACGGGGSSSEVVVVAPTDDGPETAECPPDAGCDALSPIPPPEGFYNGMSDIGASVRGVVLDNGDYYVLYGNDDGEVLSVLGVIVGNGVAEAADTFESSNLKDFNFYSGNVFDGELTSTFVRQQSFIGDVAYDNGETLGFSAGYDSAYEETPDLIADSGVYTGPALNPGGESVATMTVSNSGQVSGSDDIDCDFSGFLSARNNGDVYDIEISFEAEPCTYAFQTLEGIAYVREGEMVAAVPNLSRDGGIFFIGQLVNSR